VANFNRRFYLGWRLAASRAWCEWQLLSRLHTQGLPVPRPVAALVHWPFGRVAGLYEAALLVERIAGARTFAQLLQQQPAGEDLWRRVGACLAGFHRHGVYHADLNANNIMLDENDRLYLIDFDRGAIRAPGDWQQANLQRLLRSLVKLRGLHSVFYFEDADWKLLLAAYEEASTSP
jgi:3-deoxy-D-manno-octulosonic acid kinase